NELNAVPQSGTNIFPATSEFTVRSDSAVDMRRRYETLSRLSKSLAVTTPDCWRDFLTSELVRLMNFDFFDVVVFNENGNGVVWNLRASDPESDNHVPIVKSLWCVYHRRKPLWISDSHSDHDCAATNGRHQIVQSGFRSFYGVPLNTANR